MNDDIYSHESNYIREHLHQRGVRKVVKRTGRASMRGYFQSQKMGRSIECESKLEMDAVRYFEMWPSVVSYCEQPVTIQFYMDGKMHKYTPDFGLLIIDREKPVHAEIKSERQLKNVRIRERLDHIAQHYEDHMDVEWIVLTEKDIHRQPMLSNLQLLHYHCRFSPKDQGLAEALDKLSLLPPQTVAGANAVLGNDYEIYHLLAAGLYIFDINLPLTLDTQIYRVGGCHG